MKYICFVCLWIAALTGICFAQDRAINVDLGQDIAANVIFMRHALAPGFGDPSDFDVDDCTTQRNLDKAGRDQATKIGAFFKANSVQFDRILTSQWCRCQDTAQLMGLGTSEPFAGLNSFFQDYADRQTVLRLLRSELETLDSHEKVLMVTHQVVIAAVTGLSTASGGMVAYNSNTGEARALPKIPY